MFVLAVLLAVVAALLIAFGAELQEHAAVGVGSGYRRSLGFFRTLLHDPRWVAGGILAGLGVAVHVVALTKGPVIAIQPVGSVGLLFAVGIKAVIDRTRLEGRAVVGSVAVVAGLAVLLTLLPHGAGAASVRFINAAVAAACALAAAAAALTLPERAVPAELRAGGAALGAGMCFGVAAALVAVVGRRAEQSLSTVISWQTALAVILLICGGAVQQLAYGMGRFAVAYAVLLTADPVTAGFAGVLLLGEPMPTTPGSLAGLSLAAFIAVAGVVILAHARAANNTGAQEGQRADLDRY